MKDQRGEERNKRKKNSTNDWGLIGQVGVSKHDMPTQGGTTQRRFIIPANLNTFRGMHLNLALALLLLVLTIHDG